LLQTIKTLNFSNPHKIVFISIPIILTISMMNYKSKMDIQLLDIYIVVSTMSAAIFFSTYFIVIGSVYYFMKPIKLVPWATKIHIITTIFTAVLVIALSLFFKEAISLSNHAFRMTNQLFYVIFLVFVLSQFLFLSNILYSLFRIIKIK